MLKGGMEIWSSTLIPAGVAPAPLGLELLIKKRPNIWNLPPPIPARVYEMRKFKSTREMKQTCVGVQEVLYPGMRPQPPLPHATKGSKYVAFLSGLAVGEPSGDPAQLSLLLEFLTGMLGSSPDQITASKVPSCFWYPYRLLFLGLANFVVSFV
jgi:hypothetical protein